ncbi:hypothetical protein VKT23_016234 [Stygiomarasmius scandens]|uniref:Uncharacterized protein n=1 Tax=Marasmiellus scandens TaxID=2682957 RepID=A0ABR1IVG6_9AGAR
MDTYTPGIISVDDAEYSSLKITRSPWTPPRMTPYPPPVSTPSPPSSLSTSLSPAAPSPLPAHDTRPAPAGEQSLSQPGTSGGRMQTRSQLQYPTVTVPRSTRVVSASEHTGTHQILESPIPKPDGENGRPGRGGYSLKKILKWKDKEYKRAQAFVKKTIETKLVETIHLPFTVQPPTKLDIVRNEILKEFPDLKSYEDNWATDDFIRAALKYLHARLKYNKLKVQAVQGQAVADMPTLTSGKLRLFPNT